MKSMLIYLALSIIVVAVSAQRGEWRKRALTQAERQKFSEWKQKFHKRYKNQTMEEEAMKKLATNKEDIDKHNELYERGMRTFKRGLWEFSDLSPGDKEKYLQGLEQPATTRALPMMPRPPQYPSGPKTVDWRANNLVAPVEGQGKCGSCWAFSAKGVIEAALRRIGVNDPVSPQQLVDCSKINCYGCKGGWPKYALDYFKANGSATKASYPYNMSAGECRYTKSMSLPTVLNHTYNVNTNGESGHHR